MLTYVYSFSLFFLQLSNILITSQEDRAKKKVKVGWKSYLSNLLSRKKKWRIQAKFVDEPYHFPSLWFIDLSSCFESMSLLLSILLYRLKWWSHLSNFSCLSLTLFVLQEQTWSKPAYATNTEAGSGGWKSWVLPFLIGLAATLLYRYYLSYASVKK